MKEDFGLAFGDVELHVGEPEAIGSNTPLVHDGGLTDFHEYWDSASGLPPRPHGKQHPTTERPIRAERSTLSGATSPTEGGTDSGTQASESWNGTVGDDHGSILSGETDDCDTASRSSVKRRRMVATSSTSSLGFNPLGPVKEDNEDDVRPWKVDIPIHDVVLGDTHEPTWGTKIYREVRKPYAKKTITNEQLKTVKVEFQRRLEKELGKKLAAPPVFWCNKQSTSKSKPIPVSGFLKNRPGITYAYAKDQAIKDDVKNASARSRTRATKHFTFKGPLDEVVQNAVDTCNKWVGDNIEKELYARGFKEDLERMAPWKSEYIRRKDVAAQKARSEVVMKRTHMREARIHETHAGHLEIVMVEMINQLGNMMVEAYRQESKKTKQSADGFSVGDSSAGNSKTVSTNGDSRLGKSVGSSRKSSSAKKTATKKQAEAKVHSPKATFKPIDIDDMDISPIDVRQGLLSEHLGGSAEAREFHQRRDLSAMFSQNLRVGSTGDEVPREVDPGAPGADELSVISAPDDMSLAFMEARESAIRKGLDKPAALPQSGHVADRTKLLLQQMKKKDQV